MIMNKDENKKKKNIMDENIYIYFN